MPKGLGSFCLIVCVISVFVWSRCVWVTLGLFVMVLLCIGDCRVRYCVEGQVPSVLSVEVVDVMRVGVNGVS